jgi:hypothetical protein
MIYQVDYRPGKILLCLQAVADAKVKEGRGRMERMWR